MPNLSINFFIQFCLLIIQSSSLLLLPLSHHFSFCLYASSVFCFLPFFSLSRLSLSVQTCLFLCVCVSLFLFTLALYFSACLLSINYKFFLSKDFGTKNILPSAFQLLNVRIHWGPNFKLKSETSQETFMKFKKIFLRRQHVLKKTKIIM